MTLSRAILVAGLALAGCGGGGDDDDPKPDAGGGSGGLDGPVAIDLDGTPPQMLSAYKIFTWSASAGFTFNDRVVPYDVNTPLYSDGAVKTRAIYIPPGATAAYDAEAPLDFPVGTALIKTFAFPADMRSPNTNVTLIETRLLIRHADGWHPLPYIWDDAQKDAVYSPAGEVSQISFIDATGTTQTANYLVPQRNECQSCHAEQATANAPVTLVPIGVKARHLNRDFDFGGTVGVKNQLDHLTELGMLTGAPAASAAPVAYDFRPIEAGGVAAIPAADLDSAARTYLDINCAHCHNPKGVQGVTSQLFLDRANTDPFHLGECKRPGSAGAGSGGFTFDIVPGNPDVSILYFRQSTTKVGAMMPLLGRSLQHARGAELLHAWIAAMPPNDCGGK